MKQKTIQTCLKRYGVESTAAAEVTKLHHKETSLKKYGVDHPNKCKEIGDRISQTLKNKIDEQKNEVDIKRKKTTFEKYGDENYRNIEKAKQTKIERYGDENYNNIKKIKQTCLEKYGVENIYSSNWCKEKISNTCKEKYGSDWFTQTNEFFIKAYNSKKKRDTFGKSKIEKTIFEKLKELYSNTDYQHRDELYPYMCDYYIPKYKLYIELQGNWTHGKHAYNSNDIKDVEIVNKWKFKSEEINALGHKKNYYIGAINTWTISDPLKRQTAKDNGLNYLEIFSCNEKEIMKQIENFIKNM